MMSFNVLIKNFTYIYIDPEGKRQTSHDSQWKILELRDLRESAVEILREYRYGNDQTLLISIERRIIELLRSYKVS